MDGAALFTRRFINERVVEFSSAVRLIDEVVKVITVSNPFVWAAEIMLAVAVAVAVAMLTISAVRMSNAVPVPVVCALSLDPGRRYNRRRRRLQRRRRTWSICYRCGGCQRQPTQLSFSGQMCSHLVNS